MYRRKIKIIFDEYADQNTFQKAKPILTSAGDLVIWDSRLWHGAKENHSNNDRWSLISTFTRWWIKQNYKRPLLNKENNLTKLKELYSERKKIYELADYKIECGNLSKQSIVKKIMELYEKY